MSDLTANELADIGRVFINPNSTDQVRAAAIALLVRAFDEEGTDSDTLGFLINTCREIATQVALVGTITCRWVEVRVEGSGDDEDDYRLFPGARCPDAAALIAATRRDRRRKA